MTPISQTRRDLLKGAAALAAVATVGAGKATMPRPAHAQGSARIDGLLRQAVDAKEVPGVVAIAATPKGVLYEGAFGPRVLEPGAAAMTPDTVFRIASMTKVITSVAAMQLVEQGKLKLEEPVPNIDPALGSPLSWLMTIAHRRAVDRVRSAEATSRRDTSYHRQNQVTEHDSTAEEATQNLEARRVRQALRSLTDTQRGALELAYFGGYTHNEVSTMLGIPLGTAKTRIRDGLIRLRDTLGVDS